MRILVADREPRVRYALSVLLQEQTGWTVEGNVMDERGLFEKITVGAPDVLLLDWDILKKMDWSALPNLHQRATSMNIIVLGTDPARRTEALARGADHFISKVDHPNILLQALRYCEHNRRNLTGMKGQKDDRFIKPAGSGNTF
jgi:DNA-binding NarL/FixJ family response regulator